MDKLKTTNILLLIIVFFLVGFVLQLTREVLIPILLAFILAYIMDPAVHLFRKRLNLPLWLSVLGASVLFLILFTAFAVLFYRSLNDFAHSFPVYQKKITLILKDATARLNSMLNGSIKIDLLESFNKLQITFVLAPRIESE